MMISERRWWNSVAVVKPIGTSLDAARGEHASPFGEGRARAHVSARVPRGWENRRHAAHGGPSARILSHLASLMPLIARSAFLGVYATDSTVWKPASTSFLTSAALMPDACACAPCARDVR